MMYALRANKVHHGLIDEQLPFPLSTPASAGRWIRVPSTRIFPSTYILSLTLIRICPLCPPVTRSGQGGQWWTNMWWTRWTRFARLPDNS